MERTTLLAVLGSAVVAAGVLAFAGIPGNNGKQVGDRLPEGSCGDIYIKINHYQGESQRSRLVYSKELEVDRIRVTWQFSDGNVNREVGLDNSEFNASHYFTVLQVEPEGSFQKMNLTPVGCPSKSFSFP